MSKMWETDSKKIASALIIACGLVLTAVMPALAEENYACRCKGIKHWILFVPSYANCGNGFEEGMKGVVKRDIPREGLSRYIPSGVSGQVITGKSECGYYPDSGWNCGKMNEGVPPQCLDQMR
jgi:hypothetical protein